MTILRPDPALRAIRHTVGYDYDIFLSYRRFSYWPKWVAEQLMPPLELWVGEELGEEVRIFLDVGMEEGTKWPPELARAHCRSKVLVPLFSQMYFDSDWCRTEFFLMLAREERCGLAQAQRLVIPAVIADGDHLPAEARAIVPRTLSKLAKPFAVDGSPARERLADAVEEWAPAIATAIKRAPLDFDAEWEALATTKFQEIFDRPQARQTSVPSLAA